MTNWQELCISARSVNFFAMAVTGGFVPLFFSTRNIVLHDGADGIFFRTCGRDGLVINDFVFGTNWVICSKITVDTRGYWIPLLNLTSTATGRSWWTNWNCLHIEASWNVILYKKIITLLSVYKRLLFMQRWDVCSLKRSFSLTVVNFWRI